MKFLSARLGPKKWRRVVAKIVDQLRSILEVDYVVIGGGNARKLRKLPQSARLGSNDFAFLGGFRIWQDTPKSRGSRRRFMAP